MRPAWSWKTNRFSSDIRQPQPSSPFPVQCSVSIRRPVSSACHWNLYFHKLCHRNLSFAAVNWSFSFICLSIGVLCPRTWCSNNRRGGWGRRRRCPSQRWPCRCPQAGAGRRWAWCTCYWSKPSPDHRSTLKEITARSEWQKELRGTWSGQKPLPTVAGIMLA